MTTAVAAPATLRRLENPHIGDVATILETARESGGVRTLLEIELVPGGGNPVHLHKTYAERFTVVQGRLTVRVDGVDRELAPGDEATVPARTPHCFRNDSAAPVLFQVELFPGHEGFEKALQAGYGLAADGRTNRRSVPKNLLEAAVLLEWSDMQLPGVLTVLERPLRLLARIARRRGVDRRLERRYVRT
jgi:mannose-6-phosphate isomerase-like protein (cupin superfamily)